MEENVRVCDICGCEIKEEDGTWVDDHYSPIPDGMTGSVTYVDDMGTLHMKWDNGRSLGICPDVDSFEIIGKEAE